MSKNNGREFVLVSKKNEAENIVSLSFKPADGSDFNFIAGQYVSVTLPSISGRSKCYTISSSPNEKLICLTVKKQGEFSSALTASVIGDKLIFEGPYGHFYPEKNSDDLVFIAGGIGITPFFSFIKDKLNSKAKITLLYSNKTIAGTAFFDELNRLEKNKVIDKLVYFLTQERTNNIFIEEYERISEKSIKRHIDSIKDKYYYVCGSIGFVNDVWRILKNIGIKEEKIFTESLY